MIRIGWIVVLGLMVFSCHTPKKVTEEQPKTEPDKETTQRTDQPNEIYYLGEVQILDCGIVIQITSGESKNTYSPVNLDPKFKVDKLRLKLKLKVLDENATTCSEFRAVEISEAFAVR